MTSKKEINFEDLLEFARKEGNAVILRAMLRKYARQHEQKIVEVEGKLYATIMEQRLQES